jgi:uncharacterized membrane protein
MAENSKQELPTSAEKQPPAGRIVEARLQSHVESHFSGPLPPPSLLQEYERIVTGAADRIISMAEKQAEHRQFLEKTIVVGDATRANRGLYVGGFVTLCFLGSAAFLIYNGHDWAGGVLAGLDIVGLASVFVYGTISRRAERKKKASTMTQPTENVQP